MAAVRAGRRPRSAASPMPTRTPTSTSARIFALARALRPRHRLPSRLRPRPVVDAHGRGDAADRGATLGRPRRSGHVTKLSAMPPDAQAEMARRLADAGIALTILPATDLFLMGRDATHNVPAASPAPTGSSISGVTCSLATNNVLNPFTPFGDACAGADGQPLRQHRPARPARRARPLPRHDHRRGREAHEPRRLRRGGRQSGRPHRPAVHQRRGPPSPRSRGLCGASSAAGARSSIRQASSWRRHEQALRRLARYCPRQYPSRCPPSARWPSATADIRTCFVGRVLGARRRRSAGSRWSGSPGCP